MEKPRVSYADFAMGKLATVLAPAIEGVPHAARIAGTVAWVIYRYIDEMGEVKTGRPGVKPLGVSHAACLRRIAREKFGQLIAKDVKKGDVRDFAMYLRSTGVKPCTANQYLVYVRGAFNYAGSAWKETDGLTEAAVKLAKPFLVKNGIVGKSEPRRQRPTDDILWQIILAADERNHHPKTVIDLVKLEMWQWASSRRLGESCRMLWSWWNREAQTMTVYGMKDPRRKGKIKTVALTPEAQALLIAWSFERKRPDDPSEPIFGYNAKSASAASASLKRELGIPAHTGIRLHDTRRDCGTRLVEEKGLNSAQAIGYTGHEKTTVFETNYLVHDASKLKHAMPDSLAAWRAEAARADA